MVIIFKNKNILFRLATGACMCKNKIRHFIGHKSAANEIFQSHLISRVNPQNVVNDHYSVVTYRFKRSHCLLGTQNKGFLFQVAYFRPRIDGSVQYEFAVYDTSKLMFYSSHIKYKYQSGYIFTETLKPVKQMVSCCEIRLEYYNLFTLVIYTKMLLVTFCSLIPSNSIIVLLFNTFMKIL